MANALFAMAASIVIASAAWYARDSDRAPAPASQANLAPATLRAGRLTVRVEHAVCSGADVVVDLSITTSDWPGSIDAARDVFYVLWADAGSFFSLRRDTDQWHSLHSIYDDPAWNGAMIDPAPLAVCTRNRSVFTAQLTLSAGDAVETSSDWNLVLRNRRTLAPVRVGDMEYEVQLAEQEVPLRPLSAR